MAKPEIDMTKPIRPQDIAQAKKKTIPGFVVEAVNELIAKNFNNKYAKIFRNEVILAIIAKSPGITADKIFVERWLDFEPIYRDVGWIVNYSSPGYRDEIFEPFFEFSLPACEAVRADI